MQERPCFGEGCVRVGAYEHGYMGGDLRSKRFGADYRCGLAGLELAEATLGKDVADVAILGAINGSNGSDLPAGRIRIHQAQIEGMGKIIKPHAPMRRKELRMGHHIPFQRAPLGAPWTELLE